MNKYTPTIGIEIHTQLATKTKMFCACDNHSVDAEPNTNVCPVCLALPGTLPVPNKRAFELAIILAHGLNAQVASRCSFDRKNYFYPDSPKGYQITQMDEPIIQKGYVEILVEGEFKKIGIHHAHLEEDAGKLTHPSGSDYSLVDFNRAGTPLIEIVSEPDMHTPQEARRYLQEVYAIATTLGVTHGDLQHGNFKFDLNVSVSPDDSLGTRTELKNLNSFRNAERALTYEIKRQIEVLEAGEKVAQETRGWDDNKSVTFSQRGKEHAHDYRYFPEPDIPPFVLQPSLIEEVESTIKEIPMPIEIRKTLIELGIKLEDQDVLLSNPDMLKVFETANKKAQGDKDKLKKITNWLVGDFQAWLSNNDPRNAKLTGENLYDLVELVLGGEISIKTAKEIFNDVVLGDSPKEIVASRGLAQMSDDNELETIVAGIIESNPQAVADYKNGNQKALGFFVGQVMQQTKGQANPSKTNELVLKLLKEVKTN